MDKITENRIQKMIKMLNEKVRRRYLGIEAKGLGFGGITAVSKLTGVSRTTIRLGAKEIEKINDSEPDRIRKPGGGRKPNAGKLRKKW